jgi:hypothetical protein
MPGCLKDLVADGLLDLLPHRRGHIIAQPQRFCLDRQLQAGPARPREIELDPAGERLRVEAVVVTEQRRQAAGLGLHAHPATGLVDDVGLGGWATGGRGAGAGDVPGEQHPSQQHQPGGEFSMLSCHVVSDPVCGCRLQALPSCTARTVASVVSWAG